MNNIITAIASIETKNTNNAEFQVQIFPDLKLFHDTGDGKWEIRCQNCITTVC